METHINQGPRTWLLREDILDKPERGREEMYTNG